MHNQLSKNFSSLLVTNQCGFPKGFSSQYYILVMLEKFKEEIDRGSGELLTDVLKVFDCIDYKLLIAKLYGYGVLSSSLNIISSYLNIEYSEPKLMAALVLD